MFSDLSSLTHTLTLSLPLSNACPATSARRFTPPPTPTPPTRSYDISTIASVIPAFASRKDILVLDEGVSYPIQQGAKLSRARLRWFRHNDVAHLEEVLAQVEREEAAARCARVACACSRVRVDSCARHGSAASCRAGPAAPARAGDSAVRALVACVWCCSGMGLR